MLFRKCMPALAAVAASFSLLAHGQIGVFGTITGERISGVACTETATTGTSTCGSSTVTDKPYGANFGGYYDFRSFGPLRVGAVLRGGVLNTNKDPATGSSSHDLVREYDIMGGVHASTGIPIRWLRPFGEVEVGYAKFGPVYAYDTYTKFQGLLGADISVAPFLDIRAIELGAGAMFGPSTHGTQSIGAGLVFHSPR